MSLLENSAEQLSQSPSYAEKVTGWVIDQKNSETVSANPEERNWLNSQLTRMSEIAHKLGVPLQDLEQKGGQISHISDGMKRVDGIMKEIATILEQRFGKDRMERGRTLLHADHVGLMDSYQQIKDNMNSLSPDQAGEVHRTIQVDGRVISGLSHDISNGWIVDIQGFREELAKLKNLKNIIPPAGKPQSIQPTPQAASPDQQKVADIESFFSSFSGFKEAAQAKKAEYQARIEAAMRGEEIKIGDLTTLEQLKKDYLRFGGEAFWENQ